MAPKTKVINIRATENEYEQIQKFAAFQGVPVSSLVLDSVWERIEDWEDIEAIKEYERDKANGTLELIPFEDILARSEN
ncbi:MAG: DUF6290 family protein [Clostridiales Family XIII bacterium]|jgi:uncharacterized protein (DUF1778 family)|nr:DUF6290 family protein [Clostridiales Family XIII bacterium]